MKLAYFFSAFSLVFCRQTREIEVSSCEGKTSAEIQEYCLTCGPDKIQILINRDYLLARTGSKNHKLLFHGEKNYMERSCHANLLNLPEGAQKGMIEIVMSNNFGLCSTKVEEEKQGEHNSLYHYSNTIWHKSDENTNSTNLPREEFLAWKCSYDSRYQVTPDCSNEPGAEPCAEIATAAAAKLSLGTSHSKYGLPFYVDKNSRVQESDMPEYLTDEAKLGSLKISGRAYDAPTFQSEDEIVKYSFLDGSVPFYVLEENQAWTSLQSFISTNDESLKLTFSNHVHATAVKKCWISTSEHADELYPRAVKIIEDACPVGESSNVYSSGQGQITRISFNAETPELEYLQFIRDPFYVHCDITVCFVGEDCPGFCEHSRPDVVWKQFVNKNKYQQLSIHHKWGPFFKSNSPALDFANLEPGQKE
ncbi:unnamed protein product [Oikopleura dioica]|nr:unnamed protein product [Oikopleura dioica]